MSTPENIVKFNEITATTLLHLYKNFPIAAWFELATLFPDAKIESDAQSGVPMYNANAQLVTSSIKWLIDTGYISGEVNPHHATDLVLTAKGLELLKLAPKSLKNVSYGDALIKAFESGVKETFINVASSLLTAGITALIIK